VSFWANICGIECHLCGDQAKGEYSLAMHESLVLPNDWAGEWCGFLVCKSCYDLNQFDTGLPRKSRIILQQFII